MQQIIKNCGNFSAEVLPGMVNYSEESDKGRGRKNAQPALEPVADGYATQEGDIVLGGFIHAQCAQEASAQGRNLFRMSLQEKQRLALEFCKKHIHRHGAAGHEHYQHWLQRVETFAKHRHLALPGRNAGESGHDYFRRLRRWTVEQTATPWPGLRRAVGTHLMLSPEPALWKELRGFGMDERSFLHTVLRQTMKEFTDWRRETYGNGRTLGWIAGTHVKLNGANRHPHVHLVVLKRDLMGKEVDWSVSALRQRKGREHEPDPVHTLKRLFQKHVEKEFAKAMERNLSHAQERTPTGWRFERFKRVLRAAKNTLKIFYPRSFGGRESGELGAMLRLMSELRQAQVVAKISKTQAKAMQNSPPLIDPGL